MKRAPLLASCVDGRKTTWSSFAWPSGRSSDATGAVKRRNWSALTPSDAPFRKTSLAILTPSSTSSTSPPAASARTRASSAKAVVYVTFVRSQKGVCTLPLASYASKLFS